MSYRASLNSALYQFVVDNTTYDVFISFFTSMFTISLAGKEVGDTSGVLHCGELNTIFCSNMEEATAPYALGLLLKYLRFKETTKQS